MSRFKPPVVCVNLVGAILILSHCTPAAPEIVGVYEPTLWDGIERMTVDQLLASLLLIAFLVLLVTVGLVSCRTIYRAVKQTRAYEGRALTALFYDRVEEAVNAWASFPESPVACVVAESLQSSRFPAGSERNLGKASKAIFQRAVFAQSIVLKRWLWILAAIGWSSPLIGLASALSSSHYGGGPPIALYLGLLIAVPALWLYRALTSEVDLLLIEIHRISFSIIDQIGHQIKYGFDNGVTLRHHPPREIKLPSNIAAERQFDIARSRRTGSTTQGIRRHR